MALTVTIATFCATTLQAAEKNEIANGDFSQVDATGKATGWYFAAVDGTPNAHTVKDAEGSRLVIDLAAGDGARLSQSLKRLPKEHYYNFSCQYRVTAKDAAVNGTVPNVAIRISADTQKGLWRIWDYSKLEPSAEWRPLQLEFLVPSNMIGKGVGVTFFVNDNRMAGVLELREVQVVEQPLTQYQRDNAYLASDGSTYFPRQTAATPPNPTLSPKDAAQPFFWWSGKDGDGVLNAEAPDAKLINQPVAMPLAGGGDSSRVLVLEANKPMQNVSVRLENVPAALTASLQRVDLWKQRMGYRGGFYDVMPERLLELPQALDFAAGQRLQLFLRLRADAKVKPGAYPLTIAVRQGEQTIFRVPVTVQVAPFVLPADAPQPIWGLYPDPGRWKTMTPAAMDNELQWLHDCGIRTLLLYMPLDVIAASKPLNDENLDTALERWRKGLNEWGDRYMDRFIKAGFGPIWVCNVQSLPQKIADAAGIKKMGEEDRGEYDARLLRYIAKFVGVIEEVRRARQWPEFYYHLVDEPGGGTNKAAVAEYSVLRDLKLRGYTTANQASAVRDFRDDVDIFTISNVVITSPAELANIQRWLREYPKAQQWTYGASGSYSGQDGVLNRNRFGTGFYSWLVGAKGGFLWTYQRISGSPFDDFDAAAKDAAMTYPPEDEAQRIAGGTVSTLQWEGMRAGMTDYRYLQLLDSLLAQKRTPRAQQIAIEVEALRAKIWKDSLGYSFSNRTLDEWRVQVAGWIIELQKTK
jgi:hypothetical protein